jgi:transcriptional regulator with XRE-family HTH domain
MELSERIAHLRESKGVKQYEVANALGVEPPNYSRLEKRGDKLSIEQLKAIAAALSVTLNELLGLDSPVENEGKIAELEKTIKDKEAIINSYENDELVLLMGLGSDIVSFFSASKAGGSVSILYESCKESPYCKLIRDEKTERQINSYLNYKAKESEFVKAFFLSELCDIKSLYEAMDSYNFIALNADDISSIVFELINKEWDEMAAEQERIANNPKTQRRIESMREYNKKNS